MGVFICSHCGAVFRHKKAIDMNIGYHIMNYCVIFVLLVSLLDTGKDETNNIKMKCLRYGKKMDFSR